jgi:monoamine oxidase
MAAKIIIVGAGAAGLYAAHLLLKEGHKITIIEARDRTGGRIHTVKKKFTRPVEGGAEFVHGELPITRKLIKDAGLKETAIHGEFYQLVDGQFQNAEFLNEEIEDVSNKMKGLKEDLTFSDFIKRHLSGPQYNKVAGHLSKLVEGYDGADPAKVSTFALRDEWTGWNEEDDLRIEGKYAGIIGYLEKYIGENGGAIKLSSPVEKISWSKHDVTVTAAGQTFHADQVIVTVPISILQENVIEFSPQIPNHIQAANQIGFGGVVKFVFEFKEEIEKLETFKKIHDFRFIFTDLEIPTWWSQLPQSSRIFTGWLGGPKSLSFTRDKQVQYQKAIETLSTILKIDAARVESLLVDWHIEDWVADPFSKGAYAYATPETEEARKLLNKPVEETLFFAGEAISEGESMGTVEAAFESAEEVVRKVRG